MRGIKLVSWSDTSGYALAALDYLRGLVANRVPVYWVPLHNSPNGFEPWSRELGMDALDFFSALAGDPTYADLPQLVERCCKPCDYDLVLVHTPPEYWPLYFEPNRRNVGYTAWETDRLPPHWPSLLNLADGVLVPSSMNREVCQRDGVIAPVQALPHMLRDVTPPTSDAHRRQIRAELGIDPNTTVFYSINTWEPRKGTYDLLNAYSRAFTNTDNVLLLLKPAPNGIGAPPSYAVEPVSTLLEKWRKGAMRGRETGLPSIRVIDNYLSGTQIEDMHRAGDVFVSLTRGEGWGMGGCEALAQGRPVMMTGWGGHLDYLGDSWPWLINYRLTQVTPWPRQSSFLASQRWAQPDLKHAVELMRNLHHDLPSATAYSKQAGESLRRLLSMQRVTEQLLECLNV